MDNWIRGAGPGAPGIIEGQLAHTKAIKELEVRVNMITKIMWALLGGAGTVIIGLATGWLNRVFFTG